MEEYMHAHKETVDKVNSDMPDEELLYDLAELYKVFGDRREGKTVFYSLSDDHVRSILDQGLEHISE